MQVASSSRMQACRPVHSRAVSRSVVRVSASSKAEQLKGAKKALEGIISSSSCNPIVVRLAWHDSGTYNKNVTEPWPAAGGATASIRFKPELTHGANAGLNLAIAIVEPVKVDFPGVSYSDLFQMASATAVELAGGPKIPMRYGRKDVTGPAGCSPEGNLPGAGAPFPDGSKGPGDHLRKVFYRMGFNDGEIVALSGAHTLGRSRPDRSGWGKASTKYTENGPGTPGGQSWTPDWLVFNNSYFVEVKAKRDEELLVMPTDGVIFEDDGFRPWAEKYAADEKVFFEDYSKAHLKLSELGAEWEEGPITI